MSNNSVLLIGDKNKFLPSLTYLPQSNIEILIFYFIYVCIWSLIIYNLGTKNIKLKLLGFLFGAILLIILDYINNISNEIFIDKNNDSLVSLNIDNINLVLKNNMYKFDDKNGILISSDRFNQLKKGNEIKSIPLSEWINKEYSKNFGNTSVASSVSNLIEMDIKLISASYMIISLVTLAIITSKISENLSKEIMPFILLSTLSSLPVLSFWIIDYKLTSLKNQEIIKTKLFITSISIGVTACLIFLFGKF